MVQPKNLLLLMCLFFVVCATPALAQTIPLVRKSVIFKIAPLTMFDNYNTFTVGAEIPFKNKNFTFQQEFGYGHSKFSIWYIDSEQRPNRHHFRARSQVRYYMKEWQKIRMYVAGEYFLRRSISIRDTWLGVDDVQTGQLAYSKESELRTEKIVNALHAKFGAQFWPTERFGMDVYAGFGWRVSNIRSLSPGTPSNWVDDDAYFWEPSRPGRHDPLPSVAAGFQLCFRLGK